MNNYISNSYIMQVTPKKQQQSLTIPDNHDNRISIYNYLPEANPLQPQLKKKSNAIFQFTGQSPPSFNLSAAAQDNSVKNSSKTDDELYERVEDHQHKNIKIHNIGTSLQQIFKDPIYKSYEQLDNNADNYHFATLAIKTTDDLYFKAVKSNEVGISENNKQIDSRNQPLKFESRFESGNLAFATLDPNNEHSYLLALQRDTNSKATTQWYYFSVQNQSNVGLFTFSIINCVKSYSAYEYGMKPCVLSLIEAGSQINSRSWRRKGENIRYRQNSIPYLHQRRYYSLQFSYNFQHKNDRVYFAYCYPYTFSMLQDFLHMREQENKLIMKNRVVTRTLGKNPIQLITITENQKSQKELQIQNIDQFCNNEQKQTNKSSCNSKKDMIVICARVHPGQTVGSYVCEGLIDFLLGKSDEAQNIRRKFTIKIFPMLNPDGVINGNYRTSLAGCDLNRRWKKPDRQTNSQIYAIKKFMEQSEHKKALFIDLHGHSKKRSSFMYGCLNKDNPYLCKEFPFILSKVGYHFSYYNCNFNTSSAKQGTSRMTVWKQFKVDYSYTMEMSFCGPTKSKLHFDINDYKKIGKQLGKTISLYFCGKNNSGTLQTKLEEFYKNKEMLNIGEDSSDGSESGQQDDFNEDLVIEKQDKPMSKQKKIHKKLRHSNPDLEPSKKNPIPDLLFSQREYKEQNNEGKSSPCLRSRRQNANHLISLQKVNIGSQYQNLARNFSEISRQLKAGKNQLTKPTHSKNYYRPYSFTKNKNDKSIKEIGQTLSINKNRISLQDQQLILPKVVHQEEKRYQKYRKSQLDYDGFRADVYDYKLSTKHENFWQLEGNNRYETFRQDPKKNRYNSNQISLSQKIRGNNRIDWMKKIKERR